MTSTKSTVARLVLLAAVAASGFCFGTLQAQEPTPPAVSELGPVPETVPSATEVTSGEPQADPASYYGLWTLLPAAVAILLAIITRQVVPALVLGVLVGAFMVLWPALPAGAGWDGRQVVAGVRLAAEKYVLGAVVDPGSDFGHLKIIVFTLVIGFTVGVMQRNGGTAGLVRLVAGESASPRRGALTAWLAGLVVFFDDYANTMIVGPTMRSVFDRLKISRAKLAYIVDSTAAPVASLALIGTWVGAEIGYIQEGLTSVSEGSAPAFLADQSGKVMNGMEVFIASLPYRFYPLLALFLVFLVALTGKDFGPMRAAQRRALAGTQELPYESSTGNEGKAAPPRWLLGLIPIVVLVGSTIAVLMATGYLSDAGAEIWAAQDALWTKLYRTVAEADSYLAIFYGALFSAVAAVLLTVVARTCPTREAVDAGLEGMARMFPAIVILVLAWALSGVLGDLQLGEVAAHRLEEAKFPVQWMSLAVFVTAALISFATGTSWGTMGILCPMVVVITANLIQASPEMDVATARIQFFGAVGAVLAGAVFGDHCSPISDTTVLSSIAAGCRHEEHVWTQLPYALVTAVVAMGVGDVLCSAFGFPWYYGIVTGCIVLAVIVVVFGRQERPVQAAPPAARRSFGPPRVPPVREP